VHPAGVDTSDPAGTADLARRQQRLRAELENQARTAKRALADSAAKARTALDQQAKDARQKAAAPAAATPAPRSAGAFGASGDLDDKALIWIIPVVALASLPLVVGHVAALVVNGDAPSYALVDAPGVLGRLIGEPGDPTGAWAPVNTGGAVPGAGAYWATFAIVAVIVGLVSLLVWAAVRPPAKAASGWGSPDDQRGLWLGRKEAGRLLLGTAGGHRLAVRERHSVLVVGPAHAGKTTGMVVPAVVEWEGPVLVAATKGHLVDDTIGWRSRHGDVHVYDPAATTRYHRSGWSLLADCGTWSGAIRTAADLTLAARAASSTHRPAVDPGGGDAWRSSLSMALAPYLLAAVAGGKTIGQTAEWIRNEERDEVLDILAGIDRDAARTHRSTFARPDTARSQFIHSMHEILSVYDDPVVAASMDRHDVEPAELLDGGANTLYLTTPETDQERFRPLCAMVVRRVIAAAYEISARASAPLDPPLLVVLDDVTGIAPVYDLAALASTAAARGVQLVSVFQDRAQIEGQYGDAADLLVRNHGARVVLPDGRDRGHGTLEPLVDPQLVHDLHENEAALMYGPNRPLRLELRPWYENRELRRRVETPQDAVRPAYDDNVVARLAPADQTAAWLRRTGGRPLVQVDDPTIPMDLHDPSFVDVFGSADEDDTGPLDIHPPSDRRHRRR